MAHCGKNAEDYALFASTVLQISPDMRQAEICLSGAESYTTGLVLSSCQADIVSSDACLKKSAMPDLMCSYDVFSRPWG